MMNAALLSSFSWTAALSASSSAVHSPSHHVILQLTKARVKYLYSSTCTKYNNSVLVLKTASSTDLAYHKYSSLVSKYVVCE